MVVRPGERLSAVSEVDSHWFLENNFNRLLRGSLQQRAGSPNLEQWSRGLSGSVQESNLSSTSQPYIAEIYRLFQRVINEIIQFFRNRKTSDLVQDGPILDQL